MCARGWALSFSQEDEVAAMMTARDVADTRGCSEKEVVVESVADGVKGHLQ